MSLEAFFAGIQPMLAGRSSAAALEQTLGPSPSGTDNLAFYRELIIRDQRKALFDLFHPVKALLDRRDRNLWRQLVDSFARHHPASGHDPNEFGRPFPAFLSGDTLDLDLGPQRGCMAEVADFCWTRHAIHIALDTSSSDNLDGFDQRIMIRQYTRPIPDITHALERDPQVAIDGMLGPVLVIVYRHLHDQSNRVYRLRPEDLAVLAQRQGLPLPPPLQTLDPTAIERAQARLIEYGALRELS